MAIPPDNWVQVSEGIYVKREFLEHIDMHEPVVEEKSIIDRIEEWDKKATKKVHNIIRNHEGVIVFIIMVIFGILIFCK